MSQESFHNNLIGSGFYILKIVSIVKESYFNEIITLS